MQMQLNKKNINIDDECVNLIIYFNSIGLVTKHSCSGHGHSEFNIMFDDCVTDKQIEDFIMQFANKYNHSPFAGKFIKWARKMNGKLKYNWVYICPNFTFSEYDYNLFKNR